MTTEVTDGDEDALEWDQSALLDDRDEVAL